MSSAIPKRYARALMAYARERGLDTESLAAEIHALAELLAPGQPLRRHLENRLVASQVKAATLETLLRRASPSTAVNNFARLLQKKDRLVRLPEIDFEFRRLVDELEGVVRGEVLVATDLPEKQLESLRESLGRALSKKVVLSVRKDPSIIGGLAVRIGSLSFDGSVRAQIDGLKEKLMERVSL